MNLDTNVWFGIALVLLGLERLIAVSIPPWVPGIILLALGLVILFG